MIYRGYTIDINLEGALLEMAPSEYSFSLSDNIFSLYPTINFQIKDATGLLMEYLAFTPGEKLDISFGIEENIIKNYFICQNFENEEMLSPGYMNGRLNVSGIHEFISFQDRQSFAYEGTPSEVIEEIISDFPFKELNIDSSENNHIWYRPFFTQAEMIEKIFLENVYSNDSRDTPFFAFIDSNNIFHFKSFYTLFEQNPVEELVLKAGSYETTQYNSILDFKPLSENYTLLQKTLKNNFYTRTNESIVPIEEEVKIKDLYSGDYLLSQTDQVLNNYYYFDRPDQDIYEFDILGQKLFKLRSGFLTNKVLLTIPLNTKLTCGKTINLNILASSNKNENSVSYSGKFLIERSNHIWNGESQTGFTQLLVSRKNKDLPSNYLIKSRLIK